MGRGTREMKNKPYGWVKNGEYVLYIEKPDNVFSYTPLYTHQTKDLTEDEIKECADSVCHTWKKNGVGELYMEDFARAILRKAQEK